MNNVLVGMRTHIFSGRLVIAANRYDTAKRPANIAVSSERWSRPHSWPASEQQCSVVYMLQPWMKSVPSLLLPTPM
jgi:hypothetical protein